jgi:hypothetical protein
MSWRSRAVLLKAGTGFWLIRDRFASGAHPDGDVAVVEMTRAVVAATLAQRANTPR